MIEQLLGQHHVAILAPFALPDVDDHAGAVDVVDRKRDRFRHAQARGIDSHECGPVLEVVTAFKKRLTSSRERTAGSGSDLRAKGICSDTSFCPWSCRRRTAAHT